MISENAKLLLKYCEPLLEKLMRYKADGNSKKGSKDMRGKRASSSIMQEVQFEVRFIIIKNILRQFMQYCRNFQWTEWVMKSKRSNNFSVQVSIYGPNPPPIPMRIKNSRSIGRVCLSMPLEK